MTIWVCVAPGAPGIDRAIGWNSDGPGADYR